MQPLSDGWMAAVRARDDARLQTHRCMKWLCCFLLWAPITTTTPAESITKRLCMPHARAHHGTNNPDPPQWGLKIKKIIEQHHPGPKIHVRCVIFPEIARRPCTLQGQINNNWEPWSWLEREEGGIRGPWHTRNERKQDVLIKCTNKRFSWSISPLWLWPKRNRQANRPTGHLNNSPHWTKVSGCDNAIFKHSRLWEILSMDSNNSWERVPQQHRRLLRKCRHTAAVDQHDDSEKSAGMEILCCEEDIPTSACLIHALISPRHYSSGGVLPPNTSLLT